MPASERLFLWLGPDRVRKCQRLDAFCAARRIDMLDRHAVEAPTLDAGSLATLMRAQPAASAGRLILVDEAHRLPADCVQALLQPAAGWTAWVVLRVDVPLQARHPLQALLAQASVERFDLEAVDSKPPSGFAVVDAIAQRNAGAALSAVHEQLAQGKDPLELLGLVAWQLQRWLTVKECLAAGLGTDRAAHLAGVQPWQLDRMQQQLKTRPLRELRRQLEQCWNIDVEAKTGRTLPKAALEQVVAGLCLAEPVGGSAVSLRKAWRAAA